MSGTINSQGWLLGTDGDDVLSADWVEYPVIDGFGGYDTLLAFLVGDLLAPGYGNSNALWTNVRNVESLELTLYEQDAGGYDSFNFTENMSFFNSDIQHLHIATSVRSLTAEQIEYVPPFTFTVTGAAWRNLPLISVAPSN